MPLFFWRSQDCHFFSSVRLASVRIQMNELILDTALDETYFLQEGNQLKLHTNMIKEIVITTCALVSTCAASTVTFSDQFDLLFLI